MFEIIPSTIRVRFMKAKIPFVIFSVVMTLWAYSMILTKGFNFGVDFAGGIQLLLTLPDDSSPSAEKLRATFDRLGVKGVTVQEFGSKEERARKPGMEFNVHFAADFLDETVAKLTYDKSLSPLANGASPVKGFRFVGLEKAYITLDRNIPFSELDKAIRSVKLGILELTDFQPFGRASSNEYQINFRGIQALIQTQVAKDFVSPSGAEIVVQKVDFVGAKVGSDLKWAGILSFVITTILIFLYIFLRFDFVYAPGVVLSLVHDVSLTAGIVAFLGLEFDLTMVAALLTLAGYSINDTIIVYDRIRELAQSLRGKNFEEIIDLAISQTLSRTIITSGTTFLSSLALYVWGGPVLHGFAFAMLIGVIVGTYSSIFIAAPTILFTNWLQKREKPAKRAAA